MDRRAVNFLVLPLLASCDSVPRPESEAPKQASVADGDSALQTATVNGVVLHYVERGRGEPIILVHGSLVDYREWEAVMQDLAKDHRVIAYSRRYNYPNTNSVAAGDHSAAIEAQDLAALIREVGGGPVHLTGISFGAFTALLVSLEHPELVQTITVVEPPLMSWLPELPGGAAEHEQLQTKLIAPAASAFRAGNREQALRVSLDFFIAPGAMDQLPAEMLDVLRSNLREWEAIMTSSNAFPAIKHRSVRPRFVNTLPGIEATMVRLTRAPRKRRRCAA